METARRFNYLSDLQIKREYAYERRIYDTSKAMDERFSKEFDQAARDKSKEWSYSVSWTNIAREYFF